LGVAFNSKFSAKHHGEPLMRQNSRSFFMGF
jgi:hypothetical protein